MLFSLIFIAMLTILFQKHVPDNFLLLNTPWLFITKYVKLSAVIQSALYTVYKLLYAAIRA